MLVFAIYNLSVNEKSLGFLFKTLFQVPILKYAIVVPKKLNSLQKFPGDSDERYCSKTVSTHCSLNLKAQQK